MEEIIDMEYCPITEAYYPNGQYGHRMVEVKRIDSRMVVAKRTDSCGLIKIENNPKNHELMLISNERSLELIENQGLNYSNLRNIQKYKEKPLERRLLAKV